MKVNLVNWAVVGVGLVGLCVVADRMATAQSKRVKSEAKVAVPVEAEMVQPVAPELKEPSARPVLANPHNWPSVIENGRDFGRAPNSAPRHREVMQVEEVLDEQGQKHIIRRSVPVPVFGDFNNEFAQKKRQLNQNLRECVNAYQTAQLDEVKREQEEKIEIHLRELFDVQQQEREAQLKPMEARVKKLRETLSKRAEMRDDLVQLRLKVLLQDADGMGWGPDEFLTPTRDPNSLQGAYGPYRTPLSPDESLIPSRGGHVPDLNNSEGVEPAESNDTFRAPPKKPAVNPEADDQGLNSNS